MKPAQTLTAVIAVGAVALITYPIPSFIIIALVSVTFVVARAHHSHTPEPAPKPVRKPARNRVVGLGPNATATDKRMYSHDHPGEDVPPF